MLCRPGHGIVSRIRMVAGINRLNSLFHHLAIVNTTVAVSTNIISVCIQNHHLSHFMKMDGTKGKSDVVDRHKKEKMVTSSLVPISSPSGQRGYLIREMTTDRRSPCKAMDCKLKSNIRVQMRSVHNQSSLTSASDLILDLETVGESIGQSFSSVNSMDNGGQTEASDTRVSRSPSDEVGENLPPSHCLTNDSTTVKAVSQEQFKQDGTDALGSELNTGLIDDVENHSVCIEVDASLLRFVKGKGGATQRRIEQEIGVKIILPTSKDETSVLIQGSSIENVNKATEKINGVLEEAIRSPQLDYSHFVSLPLAIHPELVEKLSYFQNSILGSSSSSQDGNMEMDSNSDALTDGNDNDNQFEDLNVTVNLEIEDDKEHTKVEIDSRATKKNSSWLASGLSDLGIDRSVFIKPKTFHLTVLMLKLWNKERVAAAAELLQKLSPKILEALENRPILIRLKGLECMKGSPAKARVLYAPVDEIGGEGRLMRACQVIIEAYVEAGLVLEKDARQTLKMHATLMNARHRKRKTRSKRHDSFDARGIFKQYGSEDWGEYLIQEVHLSQRFAFGESGYYHCCASIPFPVEMKAD